MRKKRIGNNRTLREREREENREMERQERQWDMAKSAKKLTPLKCVNMSYIKTNFYSTNHICATKHPVVNIHIITALSLSLLSAVRSSDTMPTVKCT